MGIRDVSAFAETALEWETEFATYRIVHISGTSLLRLGARAHGGPARGWSEVKIFNPDFAMTADMTPDAVRDVMRAFITSTTKD